MSSPSRRLITLHCSMLAAALAVAATGCSSATSEKSCDSNADCPSNFCKADGTCATDTTDGGMSGGDGGSSATGDGPPTGACTPNQDGKIVQSELPLVAGNMATFRSTTTGTFATAGTANTDGTHSWDLSTQLSGDADAVTTFAAPTGQWWAADFPTATYATTLAAGSDLLGVFHVDANAVTLLGVVSPAAGSTKTELKYSPAATVLALPLTASSSFTSTSTVSGTLSGVAAFYDETYTSLADFKGTMKTPYGTFPVQRLATDLSRTSGGVPIYTKRQFGWFAECFGGVATVVSQDDATASEFSDDAEITRIAP